jgi:mRNA-degrading endonuclease RelE of RelBE toxin-antitoxin system
MKVIITPSAQKDFGRLPHKDKAKIKKKILQLENNALEGKKLLGELHELRSLRAWPYRILYYIHSKEKSIYITTIMHRQGACRNIR